MLANTHPPSSAILTLNQRLTEAMKKQGFTITHLAEKAQVAVGTIQKMMTDPHCNPTIGSLEAICKVLNITISELLGEEEKLHNVFGKPIFLLRWDDVTQDIAKLNAILKARNSSSEFVKTNSKLSNQAFALRMKDDSMLPVFPEGCVLIFDPAKQPVNNSYVLVKLQDYAPVVFKQIIINEPEKYIKSVNPIFKENLTKLTASDKIIATLVEAKTQY